jgi:hypothetical protein
MGDCVSAELFDDVVFETPGERDQLALLNAGHSEFIQHRGGEAP